MARCCPHYLDGNLVDDAGSPAYGNSIASISGAAADGHYDRAGCREGILLPYAVPHPWRGLFGAYN